MVEELVELVDVADMVRGQQLQPPLHFFDGIPQSIRGQLRLSDDRREEVRDALVHAQLDALRVDEDHANLLRRAFEQYAHDHGVDRNRLTGTRRTRDQNVRHRRQICRHDAAVDVLAQRNRQLALALGERLALDDVAQPDRLAVVIRHLDSDRRFARHALNQDRLGRHREAQVVGQAGYSGVFDAGIRTELECRNHRPGIDLRHLPVDAELGALLH